MFGKVNRTYLHHQFNKVKNFTGHAYHHTKNFLGDLDHGIKTFKTVYQSLQPFLEQHGAHHTNLHRNVTKAITGYDTIRNKVIESHDNLHRIHNIVNPLLSQ